ncbi:MAG: ABC transporter permease, partial [Patescibacteria group bacterium]
EIGLRKALGATNRDILTQFLLEAMLLTGAGGIIGITLGGLLAFVAAVVLTAVVGLSWSFTLPLSAVVIGVAVAAVIGLVFGIYPARQAALKSPIEALRYE